MSLDPLGLSYGILKVNSNGVEIWKYSNVIPRQGAKRCWLFADRMSVSAFLSLFLVGTCEKSANVSL